MVHAELFFDPQTHTGAACHRRSSRACTACRRSHAEFGISSQLILCFLRHLSEDEAFATLELALPLHRRWAGQQRARQPAGEVRVSHAAAEPWACAWWHAGEEGPPAYIERALDVLKVSASTTACAAPKARRWCSDWRAERVPLTVCPLSNVKLCVFGSLDQHNLPALLEAGLCATVNSDDPAYFGGYVNQNYLDTFAALPQLTARHAHQLAANSFEAAFAAGAEAALARELDAVFERVMA